MLYTETVPPATLELLKDLMTDAQLNEFFLVGGMALSLQINHRISIDLDFFTLKEFNENVLSTHLETQRNFKLDSLARNTIKGKIDKVIVDLITHSYPLAKEVNLIEGVRLASLEDIAAMKLNAIVGNGTRLKDFIDIAYLSSHLSLNEMLDAYEHKYSSRNHVMVLKSLSYFDDVNQHEPIKLFDAVYQWDAIKARILAMIEEPDKLFESSPMR
ncbi:MAG: nucleotidyl transferase AbiEii/AbiGii toxin family protein [Chitinophagaceae bacterium]